MQFMNIRSFILISSSWYSETSSLRWTSS